MVSECRRYTEELRGTFRCLLKGQGSSILGAAVEAVRIEGVPEH